MRKFTVVMAALMLVMGITMSAMAAQQVEVKTNSEGITAAANACEKTGNVTLIFDGGTVLRDGDWVTMDMPLGVTLCQSFDFLVLGAALGADTVPLPAGNSGFATTDIGDTGAVVDNYLWAIKDVGTVGDGTNAGITVAGQEIVFRVRGTSGSSRIRIDVYDEDNALGINNAANYDGSSSLTVEPGTEFQIKLFDNNPHDGVTVPTNGAQLAVKDYDGDGIYGDGIAGPGAAADVLQYNADWDNNICVTVNSAQYSGTTINVSINSGGVDGNNFLTFNPSNPQVAHLIAATTIVLDACKGDLYGYVEPAGGQSSSCTFNYETAASYCTSTTFGGNTLLIENQSGTFFNPNDEYRLTLTISGDGAYFAAAPTAASFLPSEDPCSDPGTAVVALGTPATETGVAVTGYASGADCQAIPAGERVVEFTTAAAFTGIDTDNVIRVDVPLVVYDPAQFDNGDQVTVTVELYRLPCGLIFTDDRIIAEFVDTCAASVPTTTLYYPYAVALDGSQGWWYGMTIGNPSSAAGTAAVTVYESDGDVGTYTTPSIAAGGLAVYGASTLLANLTQTAGTGTLGDSSCHIVVVTQFASAGGFGMTGNGSDSTGYTAYTNASQWNN
ncbi:MAG: hypothetical protein ACOZF0_01790 [Thermodesulfobacteriota bacterium]